MTREKIMGWMKPPAVPAALLLFVAVLVLRLAFIPGVGEPLLYETDEAELHEASLGPVLGTVPQRLIWPGGLMRHVALGHLGVSALTQGVPRTPEGLAEHIGRALLEPEPAWFWMRVAGAFFSALGFALPVWLAVRLGAPWPWAAALALGAACFPLHWRHGCMTTPDALAWGLALAALTVARAGTITIERVFASALLAGLALGSKLTLLPMLPALALACWDRRMSWLRLLLAWSCGLLLGALLATPWFLADPVRLVKTMLGVVKFKPGEAAGLAETLRLMLTGIPAWLLAAGLAGVAAAFSRKETRVPAAGVVLSTLWLLKSAVDSKQVVDRYFPPLGMVLLFAALVWGLPWMAERLRGRGRRSFSVTLGLLAVIYSVHGWQTMRQELVEMRERVAGYETACQEVVKAGARRVAVNYTLFRSCLKHQADAASFDTLAEHLEKERVGHQGVATMLSGFGLSEKVVRVLGGLFDEVEANQCARLRAMAVAARGGVRMTWFHDEDNPAYARQWNQGRSAVVAALQEGSLDAAVFIWEVPAALASHERKTIPSKIPLHVVLSARKNHAD